MPLVRGAVRALLPLLLFVCCLQQSLHAQARSRSRRRPPAVAPHTTAIVSPRAAVWDSLYDEGAYFALRDSLDRSLSDSALGTHDSLALRYMRGLLAHAFNQPDEAVALLEPLVDSGARALAAPELTRAIVALGQSYLRVQRYRESGEVYAAALHVPSRTVDSATRTRFRSAAALGSALGGVLPSTVSWAQPALRDTVANDGERFTVQTRINGSTTTEPLLVKASAPFTSLDSTTASRYQLRLLGGDVVARSPAGVAGVARISVISSLQIGPVTVTNVVALVFHDRDMLPAPDSGARLRGVIGFPVLRSIGRVAFTGEGNVVVSSPGAPLSDTTTGAPLALRDEPMEAVVPVIDARNGAQRMVLALAPDSPTSILDSSLAREITPDSAGVASTTVVKIAVGARTLALPVAETHAADFAAQGGYAGALGDDALRQVDGLALDFGTMTARFVIRPPPPVLPTISYTPELPPVPAQDTVPRELSFIALLFALFIVPKALQRYRIPSAITSLVMGAVASGFGLFTDNPTLHLLATLGIVALFLFAGLEIDGPELRRNLSPLILHAAIWAALAIVSAAVAGLALGVGHRAAALVSLAVVTPSTGFILSSLGGFGLSATEQRTVKTYAIGSELLALTGLFFILQSTSLSHLAIAIAAMIAVVLFIPLAFRFFAAVLAPYAPRSEFAFLLMVAVVSAYATRRLGVYYLVGAFLVGVAAQRFRGEHPAMSSERMVDALESFGSVFIPFYFFYAGTEISRDQLTGRALLYGVLLLMFMLPIRIAVIGLHRRLALKERFASARRVGTALVPTLVFTLVIVSILHERFDLSNDIAGALVLYTVLNTLLPAFVLHSAPPEFEDVQANAGALGSDEEATAISS
jgi:Kef-type K+ transport system membrane component KefB